MKKLNLGCGNTTPKGWTNVDYAPGAKLAKVPLISKLGFTNLKWNHDIFIHNLLKPFPWKTGSVDVIYTSHTLEHFDREDGLKFLNECFRVLKPGGGVLRVIVPDLNSFIAEYQSGKFKANYFVENLLVLYPKTNNLFKKMALPFISFPHKCMYDNNTLLEIMNKIGFHASSKDKFESAIENIEEIEIAERTINAVIVEGIKK